MEAALRMHLKLFLDTKEVLQSLNRTAQAKQIKTDYKRQITDTKNRLERAQSMNSKRNVFQLTTVWAAIHGATIGAITTVDHLIDVIHFTLTWM